LLYKTGNSHLLLGHHPIRLPGSSSSLGAARRWRRRWRGGSDGRSEGEAEEGTLVFPSYISSYRFRRGGGYGQATTSAEATAGHQKGQKSRTHLIY